MGCHVYNQVTLVGRVGRLEVGEIDQVWRAVKAVLCADDCSGPGSIGKNGSPGYTTASSRPQAVPQTPKRALRAAGAKRLRRFFLLKFQKPKTVLRI